MVNTFYYRQLDILNRVYILNYLDLKLLETPCILEIDKSGSNLPRGKINVNYFELTDPALIVAGLTTKRINRLFATVFLNMVTLDRSISLDGKALAKLTTCYGESVTKIFQETNEHSDVQMRNILLGYDFAEIFLSLKQYYFMTVVEKLPRIAKRFAFKPQILQLFTQFSHDDVIKLVNSAIEADYPGLAKIIERFALK